MSTNPIERGADFTPPDHLEVSSCGEALFARAQAVLPGGVSRNAVLLQPHPIYVAHASGCQVVDVDGISRVDFANNMTSLIHGHAHPAVVEAVKRQLSLGTAFNLGTEVEIAFAEHLCARNDSFDQVRFVNSGTEAVMVAVKAARAFTGRAMIAKAEGAYHGSYDYVEVSQASAPATWGAIAQPARVPLVQGTPEGVLDDVAVIPFNDPDRAISILDRHRDQIAAVLLDPMPHRIGLVRATPEFVEALATWAVEAGALLIFDEVITFRSSYGGAQEWYGQKPDLTALGKVIGGGFPIGAVAGRRDVMQILNPTSSSYRFPLSGTFSANPITMTAGLTAMTLFERPAVERLNALTERARCEIEETLRNEGLDAVVTGGGSLLRVHLKAERPRSYRETYATEAESRQRSVFIRHLLKTGIIPIDTATFAFSTPMDEPEVKLIIERVVEAAQEASRA